MPGDKATPNPPSDTTVPLELKPLWENDPNTADWAPRDPDPDEPIPSTAATGTTATGPAATGATATTPTASSSLKHKASPKKEAGYSSTSNKIGGEDKVIKDDKGVDHFGRTFETDLQKKHDEETNKIVPRKLVLLSDGSLTDATRNRVPEEIGPDTYNGGGRNIYPRTDWANIGVKRIQTVPTVQYYLGQAIKEEMEDSEGKKWYQEVHYQTGIGSDWAECGYYLLNYFTAMTGKGISLRIKAAYVWFCNRYREGDEIYLSGYSRGAFIARTVGGWIGRHGLYQKGGLTKDDPEIDQLYQLYLKSMEPGVTSFKGVFKHPRIRAIGVWDTVPGLGGIPTMNVFTDALNIPKQIFGDYQHFHDLTLNKMTDNAFHVLALTEHKGAFEVALWEKTPGSKSYLEQVWFPGQHEDVGGGSDSDHGIPFMTMAWMMDKLNGDKKGPMLQFDRDYFDVQIFRLITYYSNHVSKGWFGYYDILANGTRRPWGLAQTHDSQKETRLPIPFVGDVQPLAFVFQKANRKPGWYYQRTNRGNEMSTFLEYPNEKMHKSVRLRYGKDNLGAFGWGVFDPYALNKWAPQQGKDGRWSWVWNGWTSCPNSPLMEAKIRKDGWEERIRGLLNFGITEPEEAVQIEQTGTFVKTLFSQFARDG